MTFQFTEQKRVGLAGEQVLDRFFSRWYRIYPALDHQQRRGIDRIFRKGSGPKPWTFGVEYKTDRTAQFTGNAFIETVSVDTQGVKGWAYTTQANYLALYLPGAYMVYVVWIPALQALLPRWEQTYTHKVTPNNTYNSECVLVPLEIIKPLCKSILHIPEGICDRDRTDPETTRSLRGDDRTLAPVSWERLNPHHMPAPPRTARLQSAPRLSLVSAGATPAMSP